MVTVIACPDKVKSDPSWNLSFACHSEASAEESGLFMFVKIEILRFTQDDKLTATY
jgi:hypothetical protein